ncbi:MAG: hypothetical protein CM15mP116_07250 [Synechococcus sp.]|nr:MAG: hypothetical protein CM15mP116_07250 [Synechococcus sp.]
MASREADVTFYGAIITAPTNEVCPIARERLQGPRRHL